MTKIRCGDSVAIDLNQVVAWRKAKPLYSSEGDEVLDIYTLGADAGFCVSIKAVGQKAFNRLHKLLLDQFAIDLASNADDTP